LERPACSRQSNTDLPVEASSLCVNSYGVSRMNPLRLIMEYQVIEQIRELFQMLIAPQLEGIKGDIRALDARFDAKFESVRIKIDGVDFKVENYSLRSGESRMCFRQILCDWKTKWISGWAA
jgi:hypothetical protein